METTVYQSNISIFHKSLDLLISSILNNNNNSPGTSTEDSIGQNKDKDNGNTVCICYGIILHQRKIQCQNHESNLESLIEQATSLPLSQAARSKSILFRIILYYTRMRIQANFPEINNYCFLSRHGNLFWNYEHFILLK